MDPEQLKANIQKMQAELELAERRVSEEAWIKMDPENAMRVKLTDIELELDIKNRTYNLEMSLKEKVRRRKLVRTDCDCYVVWASIRKCSICSPQISR